MCVCAEKVWQQSGGMSSYTAAKSLLGTPAVWSTALMSWRSCSRHKDEVRVRTNEHGIQKLWVDEFVRERLACTASCLCGSMCLFCFTCVAAPSIMIMRFPQVLMFGPATISHTRNTHMHTAVRCAAFTTNMRSSKRTHASTMHTQQQKLPHQLQQIT